jgi:hypothetical protein
MAPAATRTVELATAGIVAVFGAVVAFDSLSHDVGWNANGPGAGYFPFRLGVLLIAASAAIAVSAARGEPGRAFVTGVELRRSFSVFWPTAAAVAGMFVLGSYVPSLVYLAWMMRTHGRHGWARAFGTATAITLVIFVIFELWFQVPLAKGPVEAALGYY